MGTKSTLIMAALMLTAAIQSFGQVGYATSTMLQNWAGKGKSINTNASYFITSAKHAPARVEVIQVASDHSTAKLRFYTAGSSISVTNALAAGLTNLLIQSTNTLVAGDHIVIRSVDNDTYQLASVHTTTAGSLIITNAVTPTPTAATTDFALVSGDKIYRLTLGGEIHVGLQTNTFNYPPALWNSEEGKPNAVVLTQTAGNATNTTINVITGSYFRR